VVAPTPSRVLAEILVHLSRLANRDTSLTAAQWTTLRYFGHANRFSRTASAFASFHGTTRGTASQTIKPLIAENYLQRTRSKKDRRSARFDLTPSGRTVLEEDPFRVLVSAITQLPSKATTELADVLERLVLDVSRANGMATFGTCKTCFHLGRGAVTGSHHCHYAGEPLTSDEFHLLCIDFTPKSGKGEQKAAR